MTSPALFRAQNAREFRSLDRGPNAVPFPGREFERTDRLVIRFEVQGAAASTAKVSARIISQWGKDLAELPLVPRPAGDGPYEIESAADVGRPGRFPDLRLGHRRRRQRARVRADKSGEIDDGDLTAARGLAKIAATESAYA